MSKKLVSLFLALVMVLACVPVLAEGGITVTDMLGREVSLAAPAESVVVVMPSDCEILYAIGAGDTIIGRGSYCDYPEEVKSIPDVYSGYDISVEAIIALQPQVVVMTKMAHKPEDVEQLEQAGILVIVTDAQTVGDTYACIELLGTVTGRQDEAAKVIENMKNRFAAVAERANDSGLTVYFETTPMEWGYGLYSAGAGSFMDEIGTLCGLKNIFGDVTDGAGWPVVDQESVINANPDLIIAFDSNGMGDMDAAQVITAREGWQDMDAVKNGHVYVLVNNEFVRPGPRLADAAESLMELIESLSVEEPAA